MAGGTEPHYVALKCPQCGADVPRADQQIVCQYCGSALLLVQRPGAEGAAGEGPVVINGIRLKPFVYVDEGGLGLPCFRMMIPAGWEFRGGATWRMDNPGMPGTIAFQVWNPQGAEVFEVFPNLNFMWTGGSLSALFGGKSFGAEVRAPASAPEVLRDVVLPRYRSQVGAYRITKQEHLPDLPDTLGVNRQALGFSRADGAGARIEYEWAGCRLEEQFYGVVEVYQAPMASMFGGTTTIWLADYIFACRAAAGKLDAAADLFRAVASSVRVNPQWRAAYDQLVVALCQGQIQHIRQIGEMGRMYAQTGSEIRQSQLDDWYGRQAINDHILDKVSETIRGVDTYYDPHAERMVELPGGYGHAWATPLGDYIVTDDPSFNPNIGSNLHWEAMPMRQ